VTKVTKTTRSATSRRSGVSAQAWSLAEAKAQLSEVVERARVGGPQEITRHGKPAAMVVGIDTWKALQAKREPLVAFLRRGMREIEIERSADEGRDVEL
jgi:prevent-host-death family protein